MTWNLNSDRPIYAQILDQITTRIICGIYEPGEKLPSVRDLAVEAGVNPNTMQRAFAQLEQSGLIKTLRGNGRTVTEDINMIEKVKHDIALTQIKEFFKNMKELGFSNEMIFQMVQEAAEKEKEA